MFDDRLRQQSRGTPLFMGTVFVEDIPLQHGPRQRFERLLERFQVVGVEADGLGKVLDPDTMHARRQQILVGVVQQHIGSLALGQRQPVVDVNGGNVFLEILIGQIGHDRCSSVAHTISGFKKTSTNVPVVQFNDGDISSHKRGHFSNASSSLIDGKHQSS